MTDNQLRQIEISLNITLPERYKALARKSPLSFSTHDAISNMFYDDPKKIIKTNIRLRKTGIYGSVPLRPEHFVFGYDIDNKTYFYLDTSEKDKGNFFWATRTKIFFYDPENLIKARDDKYIEDHVARVCEQGKLFEAAKNRPVEKSNTQHHISPNSFLRLMHMMHNAKQKTIGKYHNLLGITVYFNKEHQLVCVPFKDDTIHVLSAPYDNADLERFLLFALDRFCFKESEDVPDGYTLLLNHFKKDSLKEMFADKGCVKLFKGLTRKYKITPTKRDFKEKTCFTSLEDGQVFVAEEFTPGQLAKAFLKAMAISEENGI